jgi:hypothetical protein
MIAVLSAIRQQVLQILFPKAFGKAKLGKKNESKAVDKFSKQP